MKDKREILGAGVFANLTYDETFKVIVGAPANERVLIDIIELLIPDKRIKSIERLDKEVHGFVISDKNDTFNLLCFTELERYAFSIKFMHTMKSIPESFVDEKLLRFYKATKLAGMTQA